MNFQLYLNQKRNFEQALAEIKDLKKQTKNVDQTINYKPLNIAV